MSREATGGARYVLGVNAVREALRAATPLRFVAVNRDRHDARAAAVAALAHAAGVPVRPVTPVTLDPAAADDPNEDFLSEAAVQQSAARAAKERLEELLRTSEVKVLESGKEDRYGRSLAHLTANGKDVGAILISEGLARPYQGKKRESWCHL